MMNVKSLIASLLFFTAVSFTGWSQEETLLTIDGQKISTRDFMAVYNKNNVNIESAEKKSVEEYLQLYINFKLKVIEAEHEGLDTLPQFRRELEGYIKQLAEPYLTDSTYEEGLIKEAYDRMKTDVHAKHIMIMVDEFAAPEDTLAAWEKINDIYKKLKEGANFDSLAIKYSEDPSVSKNGGDLGWFSAFRMVYPFETAAYNTPAGEYSKPFRTAYGYHIVEVVDKRPARGEIKVAHIMLIANDDMSKDELANAERKINELYMKLQEGSDFAAVARQYSEDRTSAMRGGELPWFGAGKMVPEFEEASFALQNDGDISKPFKTRYGWHIVKRLQKRDLGTYEKEYKAIKKKVEKDKRSRGSQHALAVKLMDLYNVKVYEKAKKPFYNLVDSTYFEGKWDPSVAEGLGKKMLIIDDRTFGHRKLIFTQKDFTDYLVETMGKRKPVAIPILIDEKFKKFVDDKIIEYERSILMIKYPEYKALVTEYHDGILLFDIMERKVWRKAIEDTAGLEAFYKENMDKFMWPDRLDAVIYICSDSTGAVKVMELVEKGMPDSAIIAEMNKDSQLAISVKKGKFEQDAEPLLSQIEWKKGIYGVIPSDGTFNVIKVNDVLPAEPKSLNDARGLIISAYQDYLDKKWVEELREKYPVVINEEALKAISQ